MNRNVESRFSMLPGADIQRSRFDRSQDVKFTFNVGDLIPFYVDEVLPGDTFEVTTSKVVRLQTLLTPVMDNIYLDTYFFFVPNRIIWDHWKNFMGESEKAWLPEVEYSVPTIGLQDDLVEGDGAIKTGDTLDYMGVPIGVSTAADSGKVIPVSALPLRAYISIYNSWFRDENLIDPVNLYTGDTSYRYNYFVTRNLHKPFKAAKYHDYFTSALPSRAKIASLGSPFEAGSVGVPVYGYGSSGTGLLPVVTGDTVHDGSGYALHVVGGANNIYAGNVSWQATQQLYASKNEDNIRQISEGTASPYYLEPDNLYAQFGGTSGMLGLFDIVTLRYAFQVQKFYEALARSGSRYTEILEGLFSVKSPDARLQRPEYLGGNRIPISIHQITNQSQGENDFLGDLGAMSLTTDKHGDFTKSFVEHGFVIGVCVARYDHSYPQGLERFWFKRNKFDFYFPQFANISERSVLGGEIYLSADPDESNGVFGFQEAWSEYRYKPNKVMGEMRPGIPNTLDSWHFADYYESMPQLSQEWIEEDKTNVDRTLAVTSSVSNQLFADIYIQNFSTRPMPIYSIPGLADHH